MESETPQVEQRAQSRGRAGRVLVGALLLSAAGWWVVYLAGVRWWIGDVLLNGSVHLGVLLAACSLVRLAAVRSWGSVGVAVVCLSVLLMCMNGRRVLPTGVDAEDPNTGYISVVGMNLKMSNDDPEGLMRLLESLDDDVVVLIEPQWDVFDRLKDSDDRLDRYPHRVVRRRDGMGVSPMLILSRWEVVRDESVDPWLGLSVVILRPESLGGSFRLVGLYAHSPRTPERWNLGNRVVDELIARLVALNHRDNLPLLIVGDLNAGPMTGRDRALRGTLGVQRTSWVLGPKSTFPAKMSMFGLLIDDIWVNDSVEGVSWSTFVIPGSDHRGVRAGLMVD